MLHKNPRPQRRWRAIALATCVAISGAATALAQDVREGSPVLPSHRAMYERGVSFLIGKQNPNGSFQGDAGVDGICIMALLASGEDPNFGRYAVPLRKAVRHLIGSQNRTTGQLGSGMYQHGFAMLALADCYGAVDERLLAAEGKGLKRSVGEALELAVRCALTSQKNNPFNAWRYSPSSTDADTSAAGAVLMGILGARNAGIPIPDDALTKALDYFASLTSSEGSVGYSGMGSFGGSLARSSICTLVFSVAKRRDEAAFKNASEYVIAERDGSNGMGHSCYTAYYVSQALFQVDYAAWRDWSVANTRELIANQADDGSLSAAGGSHGACYQTAMLLLSSALDFTVLPVYER